MTRVPLRGEGPRGPDCSFFFIFSSNRICTEYGMILIDNDVSSDLDQLIDRVSTATGFTTEDIEQLVDCELETDHLLQYLDAVILKRMN